MNPTASHHVYRCYDAEDTLLYVGCTHDLAMRMRYHRYRSPWFGEVARIEDQTHVNREVALRRELLAIVSERPAFNRANAHLTPQHILPWVVGAEAIHHVSGEKSVGLPGQTALSAARSR